MYVHLEMLKLLPSKSTPPNPAPSLPLPPPGFSNSDADDFKTVDSVGLPTFGDVHLSQDYVLYYPRALEILELAFKLLTLGKAICQFLYDQLNPNTKIISIEVNLEHCPQISTQL
ncbi:hypothetical protein AN958_10333 [Leucoagaricus sp. SymC.cos]|nr:hypothetical protein AN958_10333 [Leucoagaricus sp. SymC.cos]